MGVGSGEQGGRIHSTDKVEEGLYGAVFCLVFPLPLLENFLPTHLAVCFRISEWSRSEAQEGGGGKWVHAPRGVGLGSAPI